jgi:predicted ATPase
VKIKSLKIDNFKTLLNFELIEPNPFSVFVGANGVGKSNIFEALEYRNFKWLYKNEDASELFGGHKNLINFNSIDDEIIFISLTSPNHDTQDFFRISNHEIYDHSEISVKGIGKEFEPQSEGLNFYNQFTRNFSRIFATSKEANKLNLSTSERKLNFNCDNLENVLKRVLENPFKALEIKEWLNLLRPGFSDVKIEKDISDKSFIQFYEEGYKKPFGKNLISDGTYNILCLLTAIYQTDEPQFLCIEEPENGLNPYVIKELVKFFREQSKEKGHYIWLNTHSQTLVNQLQPEEIIIINKENGITVPRQIKDKNMHGLSMDEAWLTNVLGGGVPW